MVTHGISSISELVGAAVDNIIPADELDRNTLIFPHLNKAKCLGCGRCVISCSDAGHQALKMVSGKAALNAKKCVGCHLCMLVCPVEAIDNKGIRISKPQ